MKIYYAGCENKIYCEIAKKCNETHILISYYNCANEDLSYISDIFGKSAIPEIILDSGGFSARNSGSKININRYIKFVKQNQAYLKEYFVLDGSLQELENTKKNYELMRSAGLNPIPIYHTDEPIEYFIQLCKEVNYIGVGFVKKNYDEIFLLANKNNIKIHMLGITSPDLLIKYLPYSADSTSWVIGAVNGGLYLFNGYTLKHCHRSNLSYFFQNFFLKRQIYETHNIKLENLMDRKKGADDKTCFNLLNYQEFERYYCKKGVF